MVLLGRRSPGIQTAFLHTNNRYHAYLLLTCIIPLVFTSSACHTARADQDIAQTEFKAEKKHDQPAATMERAILEYLELNDEQTGPFLQALRSFHEKKDRIRSERRQLLAEYESGESNMNAAAIAERLKMLLVREILVAKEFHHRLEDSMPAEKVIEYYLVVEKGSE